MEPVATQPDEEPIKARTDFTTAAASAPSKNLTRLSVYMSNLPVLERSNTVSPEKSTSQEKREKRRLSLTQYRQRKDGTTGSENDQSSISYDQIDNGHTETVASDSSTDGDINTTKIIHVDANDDIPSQQNEVTGIVNSESGVDTQNDSQPCSGIVQPVDDSGTYIHGKQLQMEQNLDIATNKTQQCKMVVSQATSLVDNSQYETTFSKQVFDNEPMFTGERQGTILNSISQDLLNLEKSVDNGISQEGISMLAPTPAKLIPLYAQAVSETESNITPVQFMKEGEPENPKPMQSKQVLDNEPIFTDESQGTILNSSSQGLPDLEKSVDNGISQEENSTLAPTLAKLIPLFAETVSETESNITPMQFIKEGEPENPKQMHPPQQNFQIPSNLLIQTERDQQIVHPVATVKEMIESDYSRYTVIEPVESDAHETSNRTEAVSNTIKSEPNFLEDEMYPDLPDLSDMNDTLGGEESNFHPGESVSFKKTESILFTPEIYTKILDHLDTLKLLLGETALQNSAAHRERCMSMVDKIGDRLIGNRLRKTCLTRSFGLGTDGVTTRNPSKEVQTEFEHNTTELLSKSEGSEEMQSTDNESVNKKASRIANHKGGRKNESEDLKNRKIGTGDGRKTSKQKSATEVKEVNKSGKASRKRKYSEDSDNTEDEAEGYFTMLLKLNGALEEEKRRSKTFTRVQKTSVRRFRKSNVESNHPNSAVVPQVQEHNERRYAGTPEFGVSSYETSPVTLVDGRLMYNKQDNYSAGNGQYSLDKPMHSVSSISQMPVVPAQPVAVHWNSAEGRQQATYHATEAKYSNGHRQIINSNVIHHGNGNHTMNNREHPPAAPQECNGYPAKTLKQHDSTVQTHAQVYGNNAPVNSQVLPYSQGQVLTPTEYPTNSLESDIQKSLHDVDLRQATYQGPETSSANSIPSSTDSIVTYENAVSTTVQPGVSTNTTLVDTTTETSSYYTDSSVTVFNQEQVIDQNMESEMIDILEILHEGSAPEGVILKKPKGRSKRARKKRRAIAEAEKLHSLVVMAQKIEQQQKLNVLSEKQKKREFYKKIIHTYAGKGDKQMKPKDEESMILECVEQLMENQSDTEEGSTKTESTDAPNKRKGEEDFAMDEYDGFSEGASKKPADADCQVIETSRHEQYLPKTKGGKFKRRDERSASRDRSVYSPSDRSHRARSTSPSRSRYDKNRWQIGHDMGTQQHLKLGSTEQKQQMFQSWNHARYIAHLYATANKITFGSESTKSWRSKTAASLKAIRERKVTVSEDIFDSNKALKKPGGMSFRQRDKAEQENFDNVSYLKDLNTLEAFFEFYNCKYCILEVLQKAAEDKKNHPEKDKSILKKLCKKLDNLLEKLCNARKLLEVQEKQKLSPSDRTIVKRACDECIDMIENIRREMRRHKEDVK